MDATAQVNGLTERVGRYLRNLEALYGTDPDLAQRIEALPFAQVPALETAQDGHPTVRLTADDGKPIYVHSRYQPSEEARGHILAQARRKTEPPDAEDEGPLEELDQQCFLLCGLGLGYHAAEIEQRFPRPFILISEDDLPLIKAAFCVTDLSVPLRQKRLTLLTSLDKNMLHSRLNPILTPLMLGLHFITPPHGRRVHAEFHAGMTQLMRDFVSYGRVQMYSLVRNARATNENAAMNLPAYVRHPGVEQLAGRAQGYPAIIVAAGPSLARNVEQLAELRQRAVIIAVQTVLKTLIARGMPPHFVTSLDYHEISAQFFAGLDPGETILVAEPKVSWRVPESYRGRMHLLHSDFLANLLRDAAPPRGQLRAGSTVAHLAFYLAEHLGCDPILLIGQDLAYSEGLYYPAGMPIEQIWQPELSRFVTVEMKQWERIARFKGQLHRVKDIRGRDTYTDTVWFTYAEQFQSDFLASRARVIHATEGGMRLEGTEVMSLRDAAAQFCTRSLPPRLFDVEAPRVTPETRQHICDAIETRLAELREIHAIASETIVVLRQLEGLLDQPDEFNRLIGRVDELRARMHRNGRTTELVSKVSQMAELRRVQADRSISDREAETPAMARRRLKRDREYVEAFLEGCDYLLRMLPAVLQRTKEQLA